jgi:hypothetical protein
LFVDSQLVALSRIVEEGIRCPPITFLAGAQLILTPKPARTAFEVFRNAAEREFANQHLENARKAYDSRGVGLRPSRRQLQEQNDAANTEAPRVAGSFFELLQTAIGDAEGPTSMTLAPAAVLPFAGDGLRLPALRVPLEAIDAWWFGSGETIGAASTSSWFVGGFFPFSDG